MTKSKKLDFRPNEFVVYPAHGVGQIVSIEEQEVAGIALELFVISFEKDKMTLRVPTHKATEIGMRALSTPRDQPRDEDPQGQGQGQARDVVAPRAGV